jgi:hypothetical protein
MDIEIAECVAARAGTLPEVLDESLHLGGGHVVQVIEHCATVAACTFAEIVTSML